MLPTDRDPLLSNMEEVERSFPEFCALIGNPIKMSKSSLLTVLKGLGKSSVSSEKAKRLTTNQLFTTVISELRSIGIRWKDLLKDLIELSQNGKWAPYKANSFFIPTITPPPNPTIILELLGIPISEINLRHLLLTLKIHHLLLKIMEFPLPLLLKLTWEGISHHLKAPHQVHTQPTSFPTWCWKFSS